MEYQMCNTKIFHEFGTKLLTIKSASMPACFVHLHWIMIVISELIKPWVVFCVQLYTPEVLRSRSWRRSIWSSALLSVYWTSSSPEWLCLCHVRGKWSPSTLQLRTTLWDSQSLHAACLQDGLGVMTGGSKKYHNTFQQRTTFKW